MSWPQSWPWSARPLKSSLGKSVAQPSVASLQGPVVGVVPDGVVGDIEAEEFGDREALAGSGWAMSNQTSWPVRLLRYRVRVFIAVALAGSCAAGSTPEPTVSVSGASRARRGDRNWRAERVDPGACPRLR